MDTHGALATQVQVHISSPMGNKRGWKYEETKITTLCTRLVWWETNYSMLCLLTSCYYRLVLSLSICTEVLLNCKVWAWRRMCKWPSCARTSQQGATDPFEFTDSSHMRCHDTCRYPPPPLIKTDGILHSFTCEPIANQHRDKAMMTLLGIVSYNYACLLFCANNMVRPSTKST